MSCDPLTREQKLAIQEEQRRLTDESAKFQAEADCVACKMGFTCKRHKGSGAAIPTGDEASGNLGKSLAPEQHFERKGE